jgi:type IV pilus assembly protein PilC
VPLLDGLADLRDSMDEPRFREIIAAMVEEIGNGKSLSQAMAAHPSAFDQTMVSLTRAGEDSGRLAEVFRELTEALKWHDEMVAHTRNMMIYPAFAGTTVILITLFLMAYLVPQLADLIRSMGQDIPPQTRMLLAVSGMIVHYGWLLPVLALLLWAGVWFALRHSTDMQYRLDRIKLRIWPTGPILRKIILARFANTFAMMYASGISILDCLAHARELAHNRVIAQSLEQVMQEIEAGKNLTQSFHHTGIFPPLVTRMLRVGEATGQLDLALRNISYFYDRDVKDSIRKMQAILEPAMTIALGVLLGWVMLSVLSPVYDVISRVTL